MSVIAPGLIIEGSGLGHPLRNAGVPSAGTTEVQTVTIGGTPTGGTFTLSYDGAITAPISWSATNATLVANIDAGLEALGNIGTGNLTTAVGSMTAGVGTITITFAGTLVKKDVSLIAVVSNDMTGTAPTIAIATTTPGVTATFRGAPIGALVTDTTNGKLYINTGTVSAPTWTVVGAQT